MKAPQSSPKAHRSPAPAANEPLEGFAADLAEVEASLAEIENAPDAGAEALLDRAIGRLTAPTARDPSGAICHRVIDVVYRYYLRNKSDATCLKSAALSVTLAEQSRDAAVLRRALSVQGLVLADAGCLHDALRVLARALSIAETVGDPAGVCAVLQNLAAAHGQHQLIGDAVALLQQTLSVVRQISDNNALQARMALVSYSNLASLEFDRQQFDATLMWSCKAIEQCQGIELTLTDRGALALAHAMKARSLLALGRYAEAEREAGQAASLAQEPGLERARLEARIASGLALVASGQRSGLDLLQSAIAYPGAVDQRIAALLAMARAREWLEQPDAARDFLKQAIAKIATVKSESIRVALASRAPPAAAPRAQLQRLARRCQARQAAGKAGRDLRSA